MSSLEIIGGTPLCGEITIQGSKNAVLPVLAACMLGTGACVIENCPRIGDVEDTLRILRSLGCTACREGDDVRIDASGADRCVIDGGEAARIRSSILFLGALLGRMRRARLPLPGGCAIGKRPVDLHLEALGQLGVEFSCAGTIAADGGRLHGGSVHLALPSVGATENAILAAATAPGGTVIENAAREPEIDELCTFLNLRGARIGRREDGAVCIEGTDALGPIRYRMKPDRIVAGTYLLAAAATGGCVQVTEFPAHELDSLLEILRGMGAGVAGDGCRVAVWADDPLRAVPCVETAPYPGFPTDLQSPLMAVLCGAQGESCIRETIFESRFRTAEQLRRMGARIETNGRCARIEGVARLHPARLSAPDLRGGAALVIAALQARGRTVIDEIQYIERGYEDIVRDLRGLGADIRKNVRADV